jgi:cyclophilin family peptidyl-prolyl cis-trans isomerase
MRFGPAFGFIALIVVAIALAFFTTQKHPGDMNTVPINERQDDAQATNSSSSTPPSPAKAAANTLPPDQARQGAITVVMDIDGKGQISMELYPKAAPKTVEHFVGLCKKGFYNGILVHRVEPGFVVQAGDPASKSLKPEDLRGIKSSEVGQKYGLGSGGSGQNVPFEPNSLTHEQGTIAMALSSPQSAAGDSQFFINLQANTRLNGDYCVFGKVTSMDVVNKIEQGDRIKSMTVK